VLQQTRFVLRKDDDLPGSFGEALEQRRPKPTPP
jgi:hypothetical protein